MAKNKTAVIPEIVWIEKFAVLMDSKFNLPGTHIKFGLDPIIGLIPIAGNIATMVISAFLILIMKRYGVSRKVIILMMLNVIIDTVIGSIPILGSIFDFGFKSNIKNINLLKSHYYEGKHQGSGSWIIFLLIFLVLVITAGILYGFYKFFDYLISLWHHFSF